MYKTIVEQQDIKETKINSKTLIQNSYGNVKLAGYGQGIQRVMNTEGDQSGWRRHIEKICCDYFRDDYSPQYKEFNVQIEDIYYTAYTERNGLDQGVPLKNAPKTLRNINLNLNERTRHKYNPTQGIRSIPSIVRNKVEKAMEDLIDQGKFCMRVPSDTEILTNIIETHFKNQFETNSSRGIKEYNQRAQAASLIFGCDQKIDSEDREKYGYLCMSDNFSDPYEKLANAYGSVRVIFNKQKILEKTTLTIGDSFVIQSKVIASKASNPKAESIPYVIDKNAWLLAPIYSSGKFDLDAINKARGSGNGMPFKDDTKDMGEQWFNEIDCCTRAGKPVNGWVSKEPLGPNMDYVELQYHGDITIDDVEGVDIRKKCVCAGNAKDFNIIKQRLDERGIRINVKG